MDKGVASHHQTREAGESLEGSAKEAPIPQAGCHPMAAPTLIGQYCSVQMGRRVDAGVGGSNGRQFVANTIHVPGYVLTLAGLTFAVAKVDEALRQQREKDFVRDPDPTIIFLDCDDDVAPAIAMELVVQQLSDAGPRDPQNLIRCTTQAPQRTIRFAATGVSSMAADTIKHLYDFVRRGGKDRPGKWLELSAKSVRDEWTRVFFNLDLSPAQRLARHVNHRYSAEVRCISGEGRCCQ